jgi:tetratricopeptide (TPR) repeat protein
LGLLHQICARLYQRRLGELNKALALDSNFLPALSDRAEVYFSLKRFQQAIPDYDKVIALDPKNASVYNDRGLAKMELGDPLSASQREMSQPKSMTLPLRRSYRVRSRCSTIDSRQRLSRCGQIVRTVD